MSPSTEEFTVRPGQSADGKPIFSVLVRRTYELRPNQRLFAEEQPNAL